jgi:DNA helicase-2/ATP-dependent DNA helicase PcrA
MIKRHCELVRKESGPQILFYFLEDSGLLKRLAQVNSEKDEKITLNITKFFNKLKSFENQHEDSSLFAIVDYIQMSMDMGESPASEEADLAAYDAVNILTVHASKGLEFPVVFLVNLSKGRFPTQERKEPIPIPQELIKEILPQGDYHIEEERRLFYVGLTRAMDTIYMTASSTYGEGKRERKVSPFVIETIGEAEYAKQLSITKDEKVQLTIFDFKKPEQPVAKDEYFLKNFSFSQLESYKMCGLSYKYQYILKIPTSANAAAAFGDSIHRTLQKFYGEYIEDQTLGIERALEIYAATWAPVGYASKSHQQRMKEEGIEMLKTFFAKFHPPASSVVSLEKLFKIKIDDDIFITGKIDRVDSDPTGAIEIIDYKTGKKPDEKELKKSFQLSIYALAATDPGLYAKPLDQVNLTFYYLQDMEKITMKRNAEDMLKVKEDIHTIVNEIRQNEFKAKVGPWCNFCPFRMICEAWQ